MLRALESFNILNLDYSAARPKNKSIEDDVQHLQRRACVIDRRLAELENYDDVKETETEAQFDARVKDFLKALQNDVCTHNLKTCVIIGHSQWLVKHVQKSDVISRFEIIVAILICSCVSMF
jgi:hypothetical protein